MVVGLQGAEVDEQHAADQPRARSERGRCAAIGHAWAAVCTCAAGRTAFVACAVLSEVASVKGTALLRRLRRLSPGRWATIVRTAMKAACGRIPDAAAALEVHERTLYRWLHAVDAETGEVVFEDVERVAAGVRRSRTARR